jgi:hypothetical protein
MAIPELGCRAPTCLVSTGLFLMTQHSPPQRAENDTLAKWRLNGQISRTYYHITQERGQDRVAALEICFRAGQSCGNLQFTLSQ